LYRHPQNKWKTWRHLAGRAEAERSVVRKLFESKELFTGLMRLYTGIYREMVESLQTDHCDESEAQKWSSFEDQAKHTKKAAKHTTGAREMQILL
jgi:hypothetical protein